jgi:hypothetical protein
LNQLRQEDAHESVDVRGKLLGALEVLAGHFSPPEPPTAERHTIIRGAPTVEAIAAMAK